MFDVSPVYRAAYDATSVNVDTRGLDKMKADERKELEEYYVRHKRLGTFDDLQPQRIPTLRPDNAKERNVDDLQRRTSNMGTSQRRRIAALIVNRNSLRDEKKLHEIPFKLSRVTRRNLLIARFSILDCA